MAKNQTITVEQDPDAPVEKPVLAQAIVDISRAMNRLSDSGLNRRAIVALVYDSTKLPKGTIEIVLNSLDRLARDYCKK